MHLKTFTAEEQGFGGGLPREKGNLDGEIEKLKENSKIVKASFERQDFSWYVGALL
ncbi:MAG: hypothetical protein QXN15_03810 [Candidatus Jordarchaeales archaeon]|nr:hypothetical protein [Candidatus Jordarchaeia archaeon]